MQGQPAPVDHLAVGQRAEQPLGQRQLGRSVAASRAHTAPAASSFLRQGPAFMSGAKPAAQRGERGLDAKKSELEADQSRTQSVLIRREMDRTYVSLCSAAAGRFVGGAWLPSGAGHRHEYQTMAASPMIFMAVKK